MARKKGGSGAKNGRNSPGQRLGVKRFGGEEVNAGESSYGSGERNSIPGSMLERERTIPSLRRPRGRSFSGPGPEGSISLLNPARKDRV
jgi:large subunit ribosomal protein L27